MIVITVKTAVFVSKLLTKILIRMQNVIFFSLNVLSSILIWCLNVLIILIFWFRMQMEAFWAVSTSLCNLGITLSSELRLRWFKMLWNTKKNLYSFHVLRFERYWLHQGWNRDWSCYIGIVDILECSFAWKSNSLCSLFSKASRSSSQKFQMKKNTTFLVILGFCFIFNIFLN